MAGLTPSPTYYQYLCKGGCKRQPSTRSNTVGKRLRDALASLKAIPQAELLSRENSVEKSSEEQRFSELVEDNLRELRDKGITDVDFVKKDGDKILVRVFHTLPPEYADDNFLSSTISTIGFLSPTSPIVIDQAYRFEYIMAPIQTPVCIHGAGFGTDTVVLRPSACDSQAQLTSTVA